MSPHADSSAPERFATRWAVACALAGSAVALLAAGPLAAASVIVGATAGVLAGRSLVSLVTAAFVRPEDVKGARRLALLGALFRYPLLGGALAACVIVLEMPASWLALGVTAWPATLLAAAWRWGQAEDARARRGEVAR